MLQTVHTGPAKRHEWPLFRSERQGTRIAIVLPMGVRRLEELIAWQLAVAFKTEVYRLLDRSGASRRDLRFRDQLQDALLGTEANIAEGFNRNSPRQFVQFLSYARGSHAEAETRLRDGIARGYFAASDCEPALLLAKRCSMAILRLLQSVERFTRK